MNEAEIDTLKEQVAPANEADEEQDDSAESESDTEAEGQATAEEEEQERLYAKKYKTPEELEAAYEEIQRFTGNRKELEEKARAYDQLVKQSAPPTRAPQGLPKMQAFVQQDGSIDVAGYDQAMEAFNAQLIQGTTEASTRVSREQVDMERAERDFPYLVTDERSAKLVASLYRSGSAPTLYAAAQEIDAMRKDSASSGAKKGAESERREISKKIRGNTERSSARSSEYAGEMTEASFDKLSLEERAEYINDKFAKGEWKNE